MYLAEIHGKLSRDNENKEDILTSNVFSFFKYAPRQIFLRNLLKELGIDVSDKEAKEAEFNFWPKFKDKTEPDLVLLVGDYYLLIEAKYLSGFGEKTAKRESQLLREIEGGSFEARNLGLKFKVIAMTADYVEKEATFNEIPQKFRDDFIWRNWQKVNSLITGIVETGTVMDPETKLLAMDLVSLLSGKGLRSFQRLGILEGTKKVRCFDAVFFMAKTALRRGSFIGYTEALSSKARINRYKDPIYFKKGVLLFQKHGLPEKKRIK